MSSEWVIALAAVGNLIIIGVLACVTKRYADETKRIAEATRDQALASVRMAEEMREQRLLTTRPILLLYPLAEQAEPQSNEEAMLLALKGPVPETTPVTLTNVGAGIAVGIRLPYKPEGESPRERVVHYLLSGSNETESHFHLRPLESSSGRRILTVTYYDVFGNRYESTCEFHKEPDSNHYVFTPLVHREVSK